MAAEEGHLRVLSAELGRLQGAIAKLVSSNAELKQAIAEEGDDEDRTFKTAIEENIVVIAKYRAQAEALEKELEELRGGRHQLGQTQALTTQEPPPAAGTAAAAGIAAAGQQERQQQQRQQGVGMAAAGVAAAAEQGGDAAMAEVGREDSGQQKEGPQCAPGGGGLWM